MSLSEIAQRVRVRLAQDRAELCVASEPLRKILPVLYPQCSDKRIAPLASDLAVSVSAAIVEPIVTVLTHVLLPKILLRAPARAPATPAAIARTIARHDAAAEAARGGVAQVDDASQLVCRVNRTGRRSLIVARRPGTIHVASLWQLTTGH